MKSSAKLSTSGGSYAAKRCHLCRSLYTSRTTNRIIFRFSSERLQNRPRNSELVATKICRFLRQNEVLNF